MKYGDWQLRDTSAYYKSQNIVLYPSSNSSDAGALHLENNVRSISRRIARKSYKLHDNDFVVTRNTDNKSVTISAGEASIQGYHLITNSNITIQLPVSTEVSSWSLGISLSYDAANNVTGDVINNSESVGNNEVFSGVYIDFFDECQLRSNYDNILVLARIWEKDGSIVDNTDVDSGEYAGRHITEGIQQDPVNDHSIYSENVEITINGVQTTKYDAIQTKDIPNISNISMYDSVEYPVEQDKSKYTKPPTFTTDIQDYINFMPDWYTCKYGDYMTGALRFNNLSVDAKISLDPQHASEYLKDDSGANGNEGKYHNTDGIIISPRPIKHLSREDSLLDPYNLLINDTLEQELYANGGTIMSIVPRSYKDGIDTKFGTSAYSALVSQTKGDIGMVMHTFSGGYSRISMPSNGEDSSNSFLYIENTSTPNIDYSTRNNDVSRIRLDHGRGFFTSYNDGGFQFISNDANSEDQYISSLAFRIDRNCLSASLYNSTDVNTFETAAVRPENPYDVAPNFVKTQIQMGVGCDYKGILQPFRGHTNNEGIDVYGYEQSPYMLIGNMLMNSTDIYIGKDNNIPKQLEDSKDSDYCFKLNTIRNYDMIYNGVVKYKATTDSETREYTEFPVNAYHYSRYHIPGSPVSDPHCSPFIRMLPGVYTEEAVIEDYLQVGVSKQDDVFDANALDHTKHKIIIGKSHNSDRVSGQDNTKLYTFIEQDVPQSENSSDYSVPYIFNKMMPSVHSEDGDTECRYSEIGGIFSYGNIGCSNAFMGQGKGYEVPPYTPSDNNDGSLVITTDDMPYTRYNEFVRFTRYRYDRDNDLQHGGTNRVESEEVDHELTYGDTYNIEFNTCIKNKRANQIIWRYMGGAEDEDDQPVTLSYIHDVRPVDNASQSSNHGTIYPDETYYDHNMYLHQNPSYGVRDFLRLDGAGLSVHGDVNNPTLAGDQNNSVEHLGITLLQGRIYSSTYNDYAETYEKANEAEQAIEGMVVALDTETGKYKICDSYESPLVVGVISDNYGMLIGGKTIDSTQDHINSVEQHKEFAVGVAGKLIVNIDTDKVEPGDLLISSNIPGLATPVKGKVKAGTIIGKVLSNAKPVENTSYYKCLMQIMLS